MKTRIPLPLRVICFLALACAMLACGFADDHPDPLVRIDVMLLAMPEEKFLTLQASLRDNEKLGKMIPDLIDAVKRKEMILEGWPVVVLKSGMRGETGTYKELTDPWMIGPLPTSPPQFETRHAGVTLEVEPVISTDGKSVDLSLTTEQVSAVEAQEKKGGDPSAGADAKPADPKFFTRHVTTSITLASGEHLLLATHKIRQPEGYVEIFIVHAEIVPVEQPAATNP